MNGRLKFLHVLWSGEIGGTEEYILTLVKHSDFSRYDIHLCFLSRKGEIYEEARGVEGLKVSFIGIRNGFDIRGALRFARYLCKGKYDIIHSHMRNFITTASMALSVPKVPKILTHHVGPVDKKLFNREKRFYRLFAGTFEVITAISDAVKDNLVNDLNVRPAEKIKVIHNGIDIEKFKSSADVPPDLEGLLENGRHIVGFVGRIEYFKRPLLFIDAASELLKKDPDFYFIMVGDGSEMDACKRRIDQLGIRDNFSLLGFRRDIPGVLGLFHSMLFTTSGEGFGIVIIEAMAKGIPVFAVNEGAVPEIITDGENGFLLNSVDPAVISERMSETLKDGDLLERIGKQAARDVKSRFSIDSCLRKMEKIYSSVL